MPGLLTASAIQRSMHVHTWGSWLGCGQPRSLTCSFALHNPGMMPSPETSDTDRPAGSTASTESQRLAARLVSAHRAQPGLLQDLLELATADEHMDTSDGPDAGESFPEPLLPLLQAAQEGILSFQASADLLLSAASRTVARAQQRCTTTTRL